MLKAFVHSLFPGRVPAAKIVERVPRKTQIRRYYERMSVAEHAVEKATDDLSNGDLEIRDFFTP